MSLKGKFKRHYESYNRPILAEFMTEKELDEIDEKYTKAKLKREIRRLTEIATNQLKSEIRPIRETRVKELKAELKEL